MFKFSPLKKYGFQIYSQETKNLVNSTVTTSSAIVNEGTPEERWDESERKCSAFHNVLRDYKHL